MTPLRGDSSVGRTLWFAATSGLAVIGLAAALVFLNWTTLLIVLLVVVGTVAPFHLSIATVTEDLSLDLVRLVMKWAARAGALVLVLCGYAVAIGLATLPLLGVVAVTAWFVFEPLKSRPADQGAPDDTGVTEDLQVPEDPAELSDEGLCLAWQRSFAVLEGCRRPEDRQAVAELRRRYLDEFERRRPDAFADWLTAEPPAAGDPANYFVRDSGRRDASD